MRVLHAGTFTTTAGGPAMSTYLAMYGLRQLGVEAELIQQPLADGEVLRGYEVPVHFVTSVPRTPLAYAPTYKADILSLGDYDIYHAQGIWQWQTYALVDAARKKGRPYVITPRGMLYPQDIAKSNEWLKRLSLRLRLLRDFNRAACVHVTCWEEMKHCRDLGITSPMAIIPNPIEIKEYAKEKTDDVFRFGYLGRVSRRKNIHGLVRAYMELAEKVEGTELLIIGGGDEAYMQQLQELAGSCVHGCIRFVGFLNGEEKDDALASCSVLVMPSEFENLGNVVLEGLVRRIPCIATEGAPWSELNTEHCGWQVPFEHDAIRDVLLTALNTPKEELALMGENGRKLMERRYSVEAVAKDLKAVYDWILMRKDKPAFVYECE